jgi:hypothetical protein
MNQYKAAAQNPVQLMCDYNIDRYIYRLRQSTTTLAERNCLMRAIRAELRKNNFSPADVRDVEEKLASFAPPV